jgi:hypothetical protein
LNFKLSHYINPLSLIYYKEWLSGFIEAKGCFSLSKSNFYSFSIGQKNDLYLLESIKSFFFINTKIHNPKKDFWFLKVYNKTSHHLILNHFSSYPFLGVKTLSFIAYAQINLDRC